MPNHGWAFLDRGEAHQRGRELMGFKFMKKNLSTNFVVNVFISLIHKFIVTPICELDILKK